MKGTGTLKFYQELILLSYLLETHTPRLHDICLDKVWVEYCSPAQMLTYKKYFKETYSVLSLDATGTLVKKLERQHNLSDNIF